jgi:hypothetical protein
MVTFPNSRQKQHQQALYFHLLTYCHFIQQAFNENLFFVKHCVVKIRKKSENTISTDGEVTPENFNLLRQGNEMHTSATIQHIPSDFTFQGFIALNKVSL